MLLAEILLLMMVTLPQLNTLIQGFVIGEFQSGLQKHNHRLLTMSERIFAMVNIVAGYVLPYTILVLLLLCRLLVHVCLAHVM